MSIHFISFLEISNLDLYRILQLRQAVFIIEQNCIYADIDNLDLNAYHLLVKQDDRILAYARFFPLGVLYNDFASIGRVLVHQDHRKEKYGHELMKCIIEKSESLFGKNPIKISAQTYLQHFYEQYGFKKISAEYLEDNIPHILMVRV